MRSTKRCIGAALASAFRALSPRRRFAAAVAIARVVAPLNALTRAYREHALHRTDTAAGAALYRLLSCLTDHGVPFEPEISCSGFERLREALAGGGSVVMALPHALLTALTVRRAHELGRPIEIVTTDTLWRVIGTAHHYGSIPATPSYLLEIRSRLRRAAVVCAMIDTAHVLPNRTATVPVAGGQAYFHPALLHVAARCGARIFFVTALLQRGRVVSDVREITSADGETAAAAFGELLSNHIASVAGGA